ncbi:SusD/RagB family nutrient-binding outer membrane lipoprotein [Balneolaceae bacterium YR4-1]|uniref:SusD/RagB family nutrient-binding outer membrane lipoprotein n=1 Tax=Halalkalibaculum roseum TaxID=2709311 RepID=A0A6M1T192_9BACT|nr:SusD/RagB family nutrient-binding outer membrane lipoprotein [Halalkalibaculum roseum]NGP77334.1 SusD/RagB family nutrient-binding outer membrane lipoprotein [Halalkalibaculum roseum]
MKTILHNKFVLIILLLTFSTCNVNDAFVDGYREDPNLPTDAPAEKVFIAAQTAQIVYHEGYGSRIANMWTQHFVGTENQYENIYGYGVTTQDFLSIWFDPYVRVLANLRIVQEKAAASGKENLVAIAKISEAMTIGTTAALFGDIPYEEAAQAEEGNQQPVFDNQIQVYESVIAKLDEAIQSLEGAPDLPEGVDAFTLEGDAEEWIAVAYTLKARFHMHLSNQDASQLDLAFSAAQNGIMVNDGSADLLIPHGTVSGENVNLWSAFKSDRGWMTGENSYALELLNNRNNTKTDESARSAFFYDPDDDFLPNSVDGAYQPDSPFPLATYTENMLIIAEVEARRDNDQQALNALNAVRQYNENTYGGNYDDLTLADFLVGGEYESTTILQEVLDEAYLTYISRLEAFNLIRRVDYPLAPVEGSEIPQRFLYSEQEANANPNTPSPLPGLFEATAVNQ